MNEETYEVTSSTGEEVSYGKDPTNESEAFEAIRSQWGRWNTFAWLEQENK